MVIFPFDSSAIACNDDINITKNIFQDVPFFEQIPPSVFTPQPDPIPSSVFSHQPDPPPIAPESYSTPCKNHKKQRNSNNVHPTDLQTVFIGTQITTNTTPAPKKVALDPSGVTKQAVSTLLARGMSRNHEAELESAENPAYAPKRKTGRPKENPND